MRKPLLALGLMVSLGSLPLGSVLAAKPNTSVASSNEASGVSGSAIVQYAMKFLGYPYTATGNSPSTGFSCIGFVSYVYRSLGINLPGDLGGALAFAPQVSFSQLQPGDVLYFQNTVWAGLSHAAIYIGGGKFINAEWYNRGVVVSSFTNDPVDANYWSVHYLGANRPWAVSAAVTAPASQPARPAAPNPTVVPATVPTASRVATHLATGPTAVVRVAGLNLRSRPSIRSSIDTVITLGTRVVLLTQRQGWYRIELPNTATGWVIGDGIRKAVRYRVGIGLRGRRLTTRNTRTAARLRSSLAVAARHVRRTVRESRTGLVHLQTQGAVTVQVNGLRIHTAASVYASVLGSAFRGQRLAVVKRFNSWVDIRLSGGRTGWISGTFVSLPATRRSATVSTAARRPQAGESKVTAAINVRSASTLSSAVVAVASPGDFYRILGWSNGWAHVHLSNGTSGWMSGIVLGRYSPGISTRKTATAYTRATTGAPSVVTAGVRIHSGPGIGKPTLGLVAAGTHIQTLGSRSGWTRVRLPTKQTGYILGIYVKQ